MTLAEQIANDSASQAPVYVHYDYTGKHRTPEPRSYGMCRFAMEYDAAVAKSGRYTGKHRSGFIATIPS